MSFVSLERALGIRKDWKPDSKSNCRWQVFCFRRKLMLDREERRAAAAGKAPGVSAEPGARRGSRTG